MLSSTILITIVQLSADAFCFTLAAVIGLSKETPNKKFFILNSCAFFILLLGDAYYNYFFRISHLDIKYSIGWAETIPVSIFQFSQAYNWYSLITKGKNSIFSIYNLPYLLFTLMITFILVFYFATTKSFSHTTTLYQSLSISLDMLTWFFAIICLARTRSTSVIFLTLGCLMIVSADLTVRCLYMAEMDKVIAAQWIHIVWTFGAITMMVGFILCLRKKTFEFSHPESIQASCSSWVSITSFLAFVTGFIFLSLSNYTEKSITIHSELWDIPTPLMFTMITAVLLGNWCSTQILTPVNYFLKRITDFNAGENIFNTHNRKPVKLFEFNILDNFINNSLKQLSLQLDREIKIAAQVAHDIRSPLSVLDIVIQKAPEIEEQKRILLREAINHIRDITNNLEKDASIKEGLKERAVSQITVLLSYVLSERRASLSNQSININQNFSIASYGFFVEVIPSEMRRVLTNIINNSCEAIGDSPGTIEVSLDCYHSKVTIAIRDNGPGIKKELMEKVFTRRFTTKQKGSGLGLYYAKEMITKWGGEIKLQSIPGEGTSLFIELPTIIPPHWFFNQLSFLDDESIICVDDSISIYHAWQERFNTLKNNTNLYYCKSKEALLDSSITKLERSTYLVDYEFSGQLYNGIDLIKEIILPLQPNRIFLVTSRSTETEIQNFCKENKIFIIPKFFAFKIPINFITKSPRMIIVCEKLSSNSKKGLANITNYLMYSSVNNLASNINIFDKDVVIFISQEHSNNPYCKFIKEKGFHTIFYSDLDYLLKTDIDNFELGGQHV